MPVGTSDGKYYQSSMEFHVAPMVQDGKVKQGGWTPYPNFRESSDFEDRTKMGLAENLIDVDEMKQKVKDLLKVPNPMVSSTQRAHWLNAEEYYERNPGDTPPTVEESKRAAAAAIESNREEGMEDTDISFDKRYAIASARAWGAKVKQYDTMLDPMIKEAMNRRDKGWIPPLTDTAVAGERRKNLSQ